MTDSDTECEVRRVVALVLKRQIGDHEEVSRQTEPGWDSLKHVEIIFALEDALDVRFAEEEMATLNSVQTIVRALRQRNEA